MTTVILSVLLLISGALNLYSYKRLKFHRVRLEKYLKTISNFLRLIKGCPRCVKFINDNRKKQQNRRTRADREI